MCIGFKSIRLSMALTQVDMAKKADLSLRIISDLENGKLENPSPTTRRKLAEAYGVPLDHIPGGTATAAVPAA